MNNVIMFDFDGVIVDSLEVFQKSYIDTCTKMGLEEFAAGVIFLDLFSDLASYPFSVVEHVVRYLTVHHCQLCSPG